MPKKAEIIERVFSQDEITAFNEHKVAIHDLQKQGQGIAESIAYHLWDIDRKGLYKIESKPNGGEYKGIGEYAEINFDIAKATTSDSIAAFERFGNPETQLIDAKYKDYKFTNLQAMKKLSDAEIELAGITPKYSRTQIKDAINRLGDIKAKIALLPDKHSKCLQEWNKMATHPDIESYRDDFVKEIAEHSEALKGEFKIDSLSYEDTEYLTNVLKRYNDNAERMREPFTTAYMKYVDAFNDQQFEDISTKKLSELKEAVQDCINRFGNIDSTAELESPETDDSTAELESPETDDSTAELPDGTQELIVTPDEYEVIKKYLAKKLNKTVIGNQIYIRTEG